MRQYHRCFMVILCLCLLLGGCGQGTMPDGNKTYIYYVNADGTGLVQEDYELPDGDIRQQIAAILEELKRETDSIEYKSAYPESVRIQKWQLTNSDLEIDFSDSYKQMDAATELLLRAATVHTLEQVNGVDYIKFTVEGKGLRNS